MATTAYAETSNTIDCSSATWSKVRDGTGTISVSSGASLLVGSDGPTVYYHRCLLMSFDTSGIGSDTVTDVTLTLTSGGAAPSYTDSLIARAYNWGGSPATASAYPSGDYLKSTDVSSFTKIATFSDIKNNWTASNTFTSEASFPSIINGSGYTHIAILSNNFEQDTPPSGSAYTSVINDTIPTTFESYLTITHRGNNFFMGANF